MFRCFECGRLFCVLDPTDMSEWYSGHDCEAETPSAGTDQAQLVPSRPHQISPSKRQDDSKERRIDDHKGTEGENTG